MSDIALSCAFAENPRSRPILSGRVKPEGIDLSCSRVGMSELAWRQFRFHEFDFSELSMSSLMMARAQGDDAYIGIPIFTTRWFMHTDVLVREDAGIDEPRQLAGKRVGVPEYQQTAALWSRGILQHEFGVDPMSIHWFMERIPERSHAGALGFQPPPGLDLRHIPAETNIGEMMLTGELDATLLYLRGPSLVDRSSADLGPGSGVRPLFPDRYAEGARYFSKTGLFPVNHGAAIRKEVAERHPWAVVNMYQAFRRAKEAWMEDLRQSLEPYYATGTLDPDAGQARQKDLFPYGVVANQELLETMIEYSFEQGLTRRKLSIEEIFHPATLDL
jgi:4,5-dihydroxyphthalate decarboxylase